MNLPDYLRMYEDALTPETCAALREAIDLHGTPLDLGDWRRCVQIPSLHGRFPDLWRPVHETIEEALALYRAAVGVPLLARITRLEAPNLYRYDDDPAHPHRFHEHVDAWDVPSSTRHLSVIAYLNAPPFGGETSFPKLGRIVSPREGALLVFPSSFLFEHEAHPPHGGPKYVLVTWVHVDGEGHAYQVLPPLERRSPRSGGTTEGSE